MLCMWKFECWSINHFEKKRNDTKKRFSDPHLEYKIRQEFDRQLNQYIAKYESIINYDSNDEYAAQYFDELAISSVLEIDIIKLIEFESDELFLTSFDEFQDIESLTSALADKAFQHHLISKNIINTLINESFDFTYISITDSRYDDSEFKRILINCDAADRSTDDMKQFKALQRISNNLALNKKTIESSIKFEIDNTLILGFVELNISLEVITFHIVRMNISFLLCLDDLNRLNIYFNNLINQMIQHEYISMKQRHFVIRRYEHAFLLWKMLIQSLILEFIEANSCLLIEIELRRLHRRFDHSSTRRLYEILERSEHDVESRAIEHFIKYCHHCQMHDKFFGRFIFSIRDEDIQFNYRIVIDILYMKWKSADNKSVLHIVNETIRFQIERWLKNISARHVWDQLRISWTDIYLRSSDLITIDADKQFVAREFKQYAGNMRITVKTILVETHHSIEMMKRYHDSLCRMYAIITTEISDIDSEIGLQITFKILNDSIELDDLIFTLLVFEAYLRMIEMNVSSSTIIQRTIAMRKAMKEVQKFIAIRQMNDVLNTRKKFIIILIHELSLNSSVLIFRENKGTNQSEAWKESFKLLSIQSESAIVELSNESIKFRIISFKSYYQNDNHADNDELSLSLAESSIESSIESSVELIVES